MKNLIIFTLIFNFSLCFSYGRYSQRKVGFFAGMSLPEVDQDGSENIKNNYMNEIGILVRMKNSNSLSFLVDFSLSYYKADVNTPGGQINYEFQHINLRPILEIQAGTVSNFLLGLQYSKISKAQRRIGSNPIEDLDDLQNIQFKDNQYAALAGFSFAIPTKNFMFYPRLMASLPIDVIVKGDNVYSELKYKALFSATLGVLF